MRLSYGRLGDGRGGSGVGRIVRLVGGGLSLQRGPGGSVEIGVLRKELLSGRAIGGRARGDLGGPIGKGKGATANPVHALQLGDAPLGALFGWDQVIERLPEQLLLPSLVLQLGLAAGLGLGVLTSRGFG